MVKSGVELKFCGEMEVEQKMSEEKNELSASEQTCNNNESISYRFSGTYYPKIDDKGRFFVPAKFREFIDKDGICYITRGFDGCLWMYCKPEWDIVSDHLDKTLSDMRANERKIKRHFLGNSKECETDKQGRILIPPDLRDYAKIKDEITVVGMGNKIEIWSTALHNSYEDEEDISLEEIAEGLEDLRL